MYSSVHPLLGGHSARDAIKLALPGFRHLVDGGGSAHPPGMGLRLLIEELLIPNRVLGLAHGLRASALALGAELKPSLIEAGGQSPGRVSGVTPWGLSVVAGFTWSWLWHRDTVVLLCATATLSFSCAGWRFLHNRYRYVSWYYPASTIRCNLSGYTTRAAHMDIVHGRVT